MEQDILVSINCITYNQENYIIDALDSFLMQKTNFKYEILIHDDASTDRTPEVIKEYMKRYPDIIKPLFQTENQYQKGVMVHLLNIDRAKGKYIANCEGDDYWTDPLKLQKQVDYMEKHPECSLCVHAGFIVNTSKKVVSGSRPSKKNRNFSVEEVIEGDGGLFLTNSMFYRTKDTIDRPRYYEISPKLTDYPLVIYLSLQGNVYYMNEFMSAYRVGDSTSWTSNNYLNIRKRIEHYSNLAEMLDCVNEMTDYKYENSITKMKQWSQITLLFEQGKFKEAKEYYPETYSKMTIRNKTVLFLNYYLPRVIEFLRSTKQRVIIWKET